MRFFFLRGVSRDIWIWGDVGGMWVRTGCEKDSNRIKALVAVSAAAIAAGFDVSTVNDIDYLATYINSLIFLLILIPKLEVEILSESPKISVDRRNLALFWACAVCSW